MLFVASFVPHHHHNGWICVDSDKCGTLLTDFGGDCDCAHHEDGEDALCLKFEQFLISRYCEVFTLSEPLFLNITPVICAAAFDLPERTLTGFLYYDRTRSITHLSDLFSYPWSLRAPPAGFVQAI